MSKILAHPRIERLLKLSESKENVIKLTGFIGNTKGGIVRVHPNLSLNEFIEIDEDAVLDSEYDKSSELTELFLKVNTTITVVNRTKVPLIAMMAIKPGGSSGGTEKTCVEKRIDACKKDPTTANPQNCDKIKDTHKLLCDLFGDPKANEFQMI